MARPAKIANPEEVKLFAQVEKTILTPILEERKIDENGIWTQLRTDSQIADRIYALFHKKKQDAIKTPIANTFHRDLASELNQFHLSKNSDNMVIPMTPYRFKIRNELRKTIRKRVVTLFLEREVSKLNDRIEPNFLNDKRQFELCLNMMSYFRAVQCPLIDEKNLRSSNITEVNWKNIKPNHQSDLLNDICSELKKIFCARQVSYRHSNYFVYFKFFFDI
jgi:hypothetical protein